jgi:hypothetical protein
MSERNDQSGHSSDDSRGAAPLQQVTRPRALGLLRLPDPKVLSYRLPPMPETPLHRDLVASLLTHLAGTRGAVTHVAGRNEYPDPPRIGRHEPDILLVTDAGLSVIGEAKTGPDLADDTSREQLVDFSTHRGDDGERAAFWLCVPDGWRDQALTAIRDAGGEVHYRVDVLEVDGLNAPGPSS